MISNQLRSTNRNSIPFATSLLSLVSFSNLTHQDTRLTLTVGRKMMRGAGIFLGTVKKRRKRKRKRKGIKCMAR